MLQQKQPLKKKGEKTRKGDGQHRMLLLQITASYRKRLVTQRGRESRVKADVRCLTEALHQKQCWNVVADYLTHFIADATNTRQVYENERAENLDAIVRHAQLLRNRIPGRQLRSLNGRLRGGGTPHCDGEPSPAVQKEAWLAALSVRMGEAGESPASALQAFRSRHATDAKVEKAMLHEDAQRGRDGGGDVESGSLLQQRLNTMKLLDMAMHRRLEVTKGYVGLLERALLVCKARESIMNGAITGAMDEFRELLVESRRVAARAKACEGALAEIMATPPTPANSIVWAFRQEWYPGREYAKFAEKTKARFGEGSDELFVATEVISQQHRDSSGGDYSGFWAVNIGTLGEGGFGAVLELSVPTLGMSYAAKECKKTADEGGERNAALDPGAQMTLIVEMIIHNILPIHPNIAQPVAVDDRFPEKLVVLFELAQGDFLSYAWGDESASMGVLMQLLTDAARGLQHLGRHGYGHNDVKAENILVFEESGVLVSKVADLGCALAHGDMRAGHGSIGGRVPEGMHCRRVPCEPSQDVYALAHLVLVTFSKEDFKSHNMWITGPVLTEEDIRRCGDKKSEEEKLAFVEEVTLRNQISPQARAKLLNPDHLLDDLDDGVKSMVVKLLASALSPDPTQRPSMSEMVTAMATMTKLVVENDQQRSSQAVNVAMPVIPVIEIPPTPSLFARDFGLDSQVGGRDSPKNSAVGSSGQAVNVATPVIPVVEIPPTPSLFARDFGLDSQVVGRNSPKNSAVGSSGHGVDNNPPMEIGVVPRTVNLPLVDPKLLGGSRLSDEAAQVTPASEAPHMGESLAIRSLPPRAYPLTLKAGSGENSGGGGSVAPFPCSDETSPAEGPAPGGTDGGGGEAAGGKEGHRGSPTRNVPPSTGGEPLPRKGRRGRGKRRRGARGAERIPAVAIIAEASARNNHFGNKIEGGDSGSEQRPPLPRSDDRESSGSTPKKCGVEKGYGVGRQHFPPQGSLQQADANRRAEAAPMVPVVGANSGVPRRHQRHIARVARGGMGVFTPNNHLDANKAGGQRRSGERGSKRQTAINVGGSRRQGSAYNEQGTFSSTRHPKLAYIPRNSVPQPQYYPQQPCARAAGVSVVPNFCPWCPSAMWQQVHHVGGGTGLVYCSAQAPQSLPQHYNYPAHVNGAGRVGVPFFPTPAPCVAYAQYFPGHPVGVAMMPRCW